MFIIKIILFDSVSVLFCVFHICFGARSSGKIVSLSNFPTGKKFRADSRCSCYASNVNVVFSLFNERECMEKESIESSPNKNKSTLVVYVAVSADQNGQFHRFERFYVSLAICYPVSATL